LRFIPTDAVIKAATIGDAIQYARGTTTHRREHLRFGPSPGAATRET
jgi:hypothetical protein